MWLGLLFIIVGTLLASNLRTQLETRQCSEWILTQEEIDSSRGPNPREATGIQLLTTHNAVQLLVDGADYMKVLYDEMEQTRAGDFIYATSFEEDLDVMLKPNASDPVGSEYTSVENILARAIQRGVDIKVLANLNAVLGVFALMFCTRLNRICGHLCCGPEARHHNIVTGHLHTKMVIVKHGDNTIVFNGGMDLAHGRWDTYRHDYSPEYRMDGDFLGLTAMHDHMVRITGPAVVDYVRHFYLSWNDPYPPVFPLVWLPKYDWVEPPYVSTRDEGVQIQMLRTFACKGGKEGYYRNAAPEGEHSSLDGFKKMVRRARSYLYLVDQCMSFVEPLRFVREALPHLKAVIVLTDPQSAPSLMQQERYYLQYQALSELVADPEQRHKVHIFSLVRDTDPKEIIYVHSKMFMADDEYMITGSFGMERSGMTSDLEVGAGFCEPSGDMVAQYRKKLWAEHLRLDENDPRLQDPLEGLQEWIRQADARSGRVRHYFPKKVAKTALTDLYNYAYEGEGRCLT